MKPVQRNATSTWNDPSSLASPPDLKKWLIERENHYGGFHTGIPRKTVSPHDPRPKEELYPLTGGDRMSAHGYADDYAQHLAPFARRGKKVVLVEAGILRGTGLAIWSDLFPNGRIIGLDIDLANIEQNLPFLREKGAFSTQAPELHLFDQFVDESAKVESILGADRIDIYIDDGAHFTTSILQSFASVHRFFSKNFVCFIEDDCNIAWLLQKHYPQYSFRQSGLLTVGVRAPWWQHLKHRLGAIYRGLFGENEDK